MQRKTGNQPESMSLARAGRLCLQATSRNSCLLRRAEDGSSDAIRSFQQIRQMSGKKHSLSAVIWFKMDVMVLKLQCGVALVSKLTLQAVITVQE